jgi:hypothetical protein
LRRERRDDTLDRMNGFELCALALCERALDAALDDVISDLDVVPRPEALGVYLEAHLARVDPVVLALNLTLGGRETLRALVEPKLADRRIEQYAG